MSDGGEFIGHANCARSKSRLISAGREAAEQLVPVAVLAVVRIDPLEPRLAISPELVLDDHALEVPAAGLAKQADAGELGVVDVDERLP